jgi:hypothetical protein
MSDVRPSVRQPRVFYVRTVVSAFVLLLTLPSISSAQLSNVKRWGVAASFGAPWTGNPRLQERLLWGPEDYPNHEGREVSIGFVRGTTRGGELSVSFVRKPFTNRVQTINQVESGCTGSNNEFCFTSTENRTVETRDVLVDGVEVTFFVPVYTAAQRVQVGVNVGGGAGFPAGMVHSVGTFTSTFTQPGFPSDVFSESFDEEFEAAGEIIQTIVPLVKFEFQAAILVGPSMKVKVSAGLNAPSTSAVRVGVTYLFGAP